MCCLVMLSSIGESNWEWELQLAHSEILKMFQITRGPEGDLKYWVLCSWLLNRESSCDWIFETTTTPQVAAVGAHCKFSCAISEPAHDCKLQQSQIRSLIAEIHKHWHSPPPPHSSTTYIWYGFRFQSLNLSPFFALNRCSSSIFENKLWNHCPWMSRFQRCLVLSQIESRNPQSYRRLELISR